MIRIIAGEWRGRKLAAPEGDDTRPTADRTRETLFSMLNSRLGGLRNCAWPTCSQDRARWAWKP
jgi:16S rRNA G966 N2-methylase RsmD